MEFSPEALVFKQLAVSALSTNLKHHRKHFQPGLELPNVKCTTKQRRKEAKAVLKMRLIGDITEVFCSLEEIDYWLGSETLECWRSG